VSGELAANDPTLARGSPFSGYVAVLAVTSALAGGVSLSYAVLGVSAIATWVALSLNARRQVAATREPAHLTIRAPLDLQVATAGGATALLAWVVANDYELAAVLAGVGLAAAGVVAGAGSAVTIQGRAARLLAQVAFGFGTLASVAALTVVGAPVAIALAGIGLVPAACGFYRAVRFDRDALAWAGSAIALNAFAGAVGAYLVAMYVANFHVTG